MPALGDGRGGREAVGGGDVNLNFIAIRIY